MSVDVKTPTKTQFEHAEFPCGDKNPRLPTVTVTESGGPPARPAFGRQMSETLGTKNPRRRRFSERAGGCDGGSRERYLGAPGFKRNRFSRGGNRGNFGSQERIVLPTKFLLGGNINDPLNLNSLSDETINKALNENTPKSSPLAVPKHRQEVHVIIPPNIQDPLGLNSTEDLLLLSPKSLGKKKRKNKHKKWKNQGDKSDATDTLEVSTQSQNSISTLSDSKDFFKPMHIEITSDSELLSQHHSSEGVPPQAEPPTTPVGANTSVGHNSSVTSSGGSHTQRGGGGDQIVSPAVSQVVSPKCRRRKRTSSEGKSDGSTSLRLSVDSDKSTKSDKTSPHRAKYLKRQHSHSSTQSQPTTPPPNRTKPKNTNRGRKHNKQFIYGNYNRYYGYRNPDGSDKDDRLNNFNRLWFDGKDVLDIGCNVGHVTLAVAKDFGPRRVTGIDIDGSLIAAAKRNVRHYLTTKVANKKYPSSLVASFGPIAAPPVGDSEEPAHFPNNVVFLTGNYVLESDELVDMTREEYDVILALSVTKWVHLNWGDAGLKRMFRRMFKQLRPGGKLILEPQLWPSYKKRKKLTEAHLMNYSQIQLRPEQFREYLLREIGFSKCEALEVPFNKAKGFQRPLQVFTKSDTTQPGSRVTTPGRSDTCSRGATPRFHVGGWSVTTSPATCDGSPATCTPPGGPATPGGPADSPRGPAAEKLLAAIREESFTAAPPLGESTPIAQRPLQGLRSHSAPCLLETPRGERERTTADSVMERDGDGEEGVDRGAQDLDTQRAGQTAPTGATSPQLRHSSGERVARDGEPSESAESCSPSCDTANSSDVKICTDNQEGSEGATSSSGKG